MGKILTQEEVDALLATVGGGAPAAESQAGGGEAGAARRKSEAERKVSLYNFRRPDRVPKEQMRSLHFLHEGFARTFSSSLSAYLRALISVSLVSVEQLTYGEFLLSLPDLTAIYSLSMAPLDGVCALEIDQSLAFPIIDRLLGGEGEPSSGIRNLTEIEQNIIEGVVRLVTQDLKEVWRPIADLSFDIHGREVRPQLLQVVSPSEVVVVIVFDVKIGDIRGIINFCIPYLVLEPIAGKFEQEWESARKRISAEERERLVDLLMQAPFDVTLDARGNQLQIRDLLNLEPGDILQLENSVEQTLSVMIGGLEKFEGRPVRVRVKKGIEIS
ncbi:MAG: flagellar motor switch protein FliM [Acidobacteria bacterium]|nr:flagellar motor switch protein FliM [Acidobacteriota bacterium]